MRNLFFVLLTFAVTVEAQIPGPTIKRVFSPPIANPATGNTANGSANKESNNAPPINRPPQIQAPGQVDPVNSPKQAAVEGRGADSHLGTPSSRDTSILRDVAPTNLLPDQSAPSLSNDNKTGALPDGEIKDTGTEINVKNADIAAIIRIFSRKAKRNYILDENVKGKVSIYLPGKVSPEESIRILDSVLALKGFTSVPISDNLWKIVPSKDAKQSTIPTVTEEESGPVSAAIVTRLLNLKYVSAEDVKALVGPLISNDGLLNAYTGTNSLIIIDSADNIKRVSEIVRNLDVPSSDREMTIIPIKHADAADVAQKLSDILDAPKGDSGRGGADGSGSFEAVRARLQNNLGSATNTNISSPPIGGKPAGNTGGASGATVGGGRSREPKIIPDDRTNSIIVVADEDTTARIRALVSQLDSEVDLSGYRFYVYHCQFATADDLAQVLSGLTGGSSGSSKSVGTGDSGLNSGGLFGGGSGQSTGGLGNRDSSSRFGGSSSSSSKNSRSQSRTSSQRRTPGQSRSGSGSGKVSSATFGDNISITADPATNSLIISASKSDYLKIKELLQELDVKRRQVLVEAMLLEVGINDTQSLSTSFLASAGGKDGGILAKNDFGGNLAALLSDPTKISDFSVAAASAGTLELPGITVPTQTILLNAAKNNSNVNVLSAPTILATDNEPAEIVVGQNVPFLASKATSDTNLNNTFNQIDRQDVGITLRLTPKISSSDAVSLQIFTEVSNVVESTATSDLGPTTSLRTSETSVVTKDGQMIVIGGLMSDSVSDATTGVPFLKDVPVLGHLFRSTSETKRRTNLLIFITPRVVKDQFDARDTTLERRDRLQSDFDAYEIFPDRQDVLENPGIDKVTATSKLDLAKPGTILPPASENSGYNAGKSFGESLPLSNSDKSHSNEAIEIEIDPQIPSPEIKDSTPSSAPKVSSKKQVSAIVPKASNIKGDSYLVLSRVGTETAEMPFKTIGKNRAFGIILPADSNLAAKNFFNVGQSYSYAVDGKNFKVKVLKVTGSKDEAESAFSGLSNGWYTLSPYEIMNLGNGPWFSAKD